MNITVDLSFLPDHLIPLTTNSEGIKQFYLKVYHVGSQDDGTAKFSVFEYPGSINEFGDLLDRIMQNNSIKEYSVAQDTKKENALILLKNGDIEQLGILICDFCGAVFSSEEEKYIHQRAHYFF